MLDFPSVLSRPLTASVEEAPYSVELPVRGSRLRTACSLPSAAAREARHLLDRNERPPPPAMDEEPTSGCRDRRRIARARDRFAPTEEPPARAGGIEMASVPLLILDDLGMRKLPTTAAEDLLELIMRRYERTSTLLTSNRHVEDWGRLLGDTAAVTAMLDRLLHHGHVLKCGPKSWRARSQPSLHKEAATR